MFAATCAEEAADLQKEPGYAQTADFVRSLPAALGVRHRLTAHGSGTTHTTATATVARINRFANRLVIHPGIIVGQLQNRGEIRFQAIRDTLVKVRQNVVSEALTDGWRHFVKV
jgi:hypothetical protein